MGTWEHRAILEGNKDPPLETLNEDLRGEPTSRDISLPVMCNKILQSQNICSVQMQE